jgi:hypothetical protein
MDRRRDYEKVEATIVAGGGFYSLKKMIPDATPRRLTAWLRQERSSVLPLELQINERCSLRSASPSRS